MVREGVLNDAEMFWAAKQPNKQPFAVNRGAHCMEQVHCRGRPRQ